MHAMKKNARVQVNESVWCKREARNFKQTAREICSWVFRYNSKKRLRERVRVSHADI